MVTTNDYDEPMTIHNNEFSFADLTKLEDFDNLLYLHHVDKMRGKYPDVREKSGNFEMKTLWYPLMAKEILGDPHGMKHDHCANARIKRAAVLHIIKN